MIGTLVPGSARSLFPNSMIFKVNDMGAFSTPKLHALAWQQAIASCRSLTCRRFKAGPWG